MALNTTTSRVGRIVIGKWHTGVGAGIAAVIPMILYNFVWLGNDLFPLFGLLPYAMLWGVLYAGIATIDRIEQVATDPLTGVVIGIIYSVLVWMGPQVGEPLGQGVFTVGGAIQIVVFGVVLGLVYAYSPDIE